MFSKIFSAAWQALQSRGERTRALKAGMALPVACLSMICAIALFDSQARAVSCTSQAEIKAPDRDSMIASASALANDVSDQNLDALRSSLLPAVIPDWDGIKAVAQIGAADVKGGTLRWRNGYLLDATDLKAPADTQFFCSNSDNSTTVTISLPNLPPGRYAVTLADYPGGALAGQLALILGADSDSKWKLGGLFAREGQLDGHDGVWFWTQARAARQKTAGWDAWYDYETARWLLLPVDFLSSPNLEKLNQEQMHLKASPLDSLPLTVNSGATDNATTPKQTWKITALRIDTTLHFADLGLTYDGTGVTDPLAARSEAVSVMSGLLRLHPELRPAFHGLWAYAEKDGKRSYAIELAMHDIP